MIRVPEREEEADLDHERARRIGVLAAREMAARLEQDTTIVYEGYRDFDAIEAHLLGAKAAGFFLSVLLADVPQDLRQDWLDGLRECLPALTIRYTERVS